jgi:alpha-1,6-mannosyltransferase
MGILSGMSVRGPLGATPQGGAFELSTTGIGARARASGSRAGLLGLSGLLITGLVIALAAAQTDNLLPESARPMPTWLAGPFGSTGLGIGHGGLMLVLALMFGAYLLAVRGADALSPRVVLATIAGLHALILLAPPLLSTDIFSYNAYSRMWALYGANPYLHGPHAIALDPLYPFIGAKWVGTPTVYGPLFTALSYPLGGLSIAASVAAYKAIAVLSSLVLVALVWQCARLRGIDPVKAVVLVGLNPLIVVYGVGGGHNDLLMLAVSMAGVYAVLRGRELRGGGVMVAAAGIKLTAGLLLPFAFAGDRMRVRQRRDLLIGGAIAAVAVAGVSFAFFGTGTLHLLGTLQQSQQAGDWHSIPGFISERLKLGGFGHAMGIALAIAFVGTFAWLLRRVWRGELDWIAGAGWATFALLVTASSMRPWYVAWLIPLAALSADRRLSKTAVVMSGIVVAIQLAGYVPHGSPLAGL